MMLERLYVRLPTTAKARVDGGRRLTLVPTEMEDTVENQKRGRVFVPGGAGYVGAVLVPRLLELGYGVNVLDLYIYGEQALAAVKDHPQPATVQGRRPRPGGGPRGRRRDATRSSTWPASPTTPAWSSTPISAKR